MALKTGVSVFIKNAERKSLTMGPHGSKILNLEI